MNGRLTADLLVGRVNYSTVFFHSVRVFKNWPLRVRPHVLVASDTNLSS